MVVFYFTEEAKKAFLKLPKVIQERITIKLKDLKLHNDILSVLKRLTNFESATHRLRIGMYRIILKLRNQAEDNFDFVIVDVGHRKDIYK